METATPSIGSTFTSPFMSPHIAMIPRHGSPLSIVPLNTRDRYRRKPRRRKDRKTGKRSGGFALSSRIPPRPQFDPSHPYKLTRRQWIIYIMYCWGFFALGLFTSAPGPILPTLEKQVNVSLAVISYIFSARAIGFVIGSMISGYVMDHYQNYLVSPANGTKFLLKKNQKIADYLWSLPRWSCCPMSSHNVFTISLFIAAITNAAIPYVHDVYSLSILVSLNGICFGNINTFGNVLLLTLFDIEISHEIDFDLIYGYGDDDDDDVTDNNDKTIKMDTIGGDNNTVGNDDNNNDNDKTSGKKQKIEDDNDDNVPDEEQELIQPEPSESYGSLSRDDIAETTIARMDKQDERVGPFMNFLQAIYAVGGFLAPIFIQISFEINNSYSYAFWFFTLIYIPPGIVLLYYPEPIRMSVVSERLKEMQKERRSSMSLISEGTTEDGGIECEEDIVEIRKRESRQFWSRWLCFGFAVFLLWYVGAQVGYGMYVTTYAIDYLSTSDAVGRYLASANWAGLFVGRIVAVPLSTSMSALNMVRVDLIGMVLGCLILFFSQDWEYAVWVSSIVVGFCMASVWPSMFVWAETLIPVTGIFASIMVGGGSLGEFIIPALQGNIMAAFGPQYFNHVMFAMAVFLLINLFVNNIIAKRLSMFLQNNDNNKNDNNNNILENN